MEDFIEDIGEGAYYSDKENERINNETPEDLWEEEFEELEWDEEVV